MTIQGIHQEWDRFVGACFAVVERDFWEGRGTDFRRGRGGIPSALSPPLPSGYVLAAPTRPPYTGHQSAQTIAGAFSSPRDERSCRHNRYTLPARPRPTY